MRMRNKPWVEGFLASFSTDVLINEPIAYKGSWRRLLACDKLHVEIGTGKGDYWLTMAEQYPSDGWIGIEKERNVAAMALKKSLNTNLNNIKYILNDADKISEWFAKSEIDVIHLNFSDPWPKKRNTKKRLTHDSFLDQYRLLLKDNGQIIMKTDNQKLFEYSLLNMQDTWQLIEVWLDFRQSEQPDAITEYEKRFMDEGKPIYRAVWQKR